MVGRPPGGEDERDLAVDRRRSKADTCTSGVTALDVFAGSTRSGGELFGPVGHDHQTGWSDVRLAPGIEIGEHRCCVDAGEGVELRRCHAAWREVVGGLGQQQRAASDAVETCRLDRHGARPDSVWEPVTGFVVGRDQRDVADGHPVAEGDDGGCHVNQT